MKIIKLLVATSLLTSLNAVSATTWTDWTSTTVGTLGSANVSITPIAFGLSSGDSYYNNTNANLTNTYMNLQPTDLLQVNRSGAVTINFSEEVGSLYMSLVSVGQPHFPVKYEFNDPISVLSYGSNIWSSTSYPNATSYDLLGSSFTGREYNGILRIDGSFGPSKSLSFAIDRNENWHGFNIGQVSAIPEPSTIALMLSGLGITGFLAYRRRQKAA